LQATAAIEGLCPRDDLEACHTCLLKRAAALFGNSKPNRKLSGVAERPHVSLKGSPAPPVGLAVDQHAVVWASLRGQDGAGTTGACTSV
jgi:hypothetical protein